MFDNFKIKTKLLIGFGVVIILMLIIVSVSIATSLNTEANIEDVIETEVPTMLLLQGMKSDLLEGISAALEYVVTGNEEHKDDFFEHINDSDKKIKEINFALRTKEEPEEVEREWPLFVQILDSRAELIQSVETVFLELEQQGFVDTLKVEVLEDISHHKMVSLIDKFIEIETEEVNTALTKSEEENEESIIIIISLGIVSLLIGLFFALAISRSLIKRISANRNAAVEIASGNMAVEIDTSGKDEVADVARAIDIMRESLKVGEYKENENKKS